MERKSPKLLEDIRDAAAFVRQAVENKSLDDYRRDRLLRQAIERNFEIIGEAVGRLANRTPQRQQGSANTHGSFPFATCSSMATT
jgi:uncharacterized protein with HEPN domain